MMCDFDESDYCTDMYHERLLKQDIELIQIMVEMREFERALAGMNYSVRHSEDLDEKVKQDLRDIKSRREASSCPGFSNSALVGQGCQDFSTFHNQTVKLNCKVDGFSTILIDYGQDGENPITIDAEDEPSEDLSQRAKNTLLLNVFNPAAPEGKMVGPDEDVKKLLAAIIQGGLNINFKEVSTSTSFCV